MRTPTGYIEESATIINCLCTQCPITNHFLPTPTTFLKGNKRLMGKAIIKDLARASSVCVCIMCAPFNLTVLLSIEIYCTLNWNLSICL